MRAILNGSVLFFWFAAGCAKFRSFEEALLRWYGYSRLGKKIAFCSTAINTGLSGSFLGRLSRVKESSAILDNSSVARSLAAGARSGKNKAVFYFGRSGLAGFFGGVKEGLFSSPLKTGGLMMIAAAGTNIALSVFFKKEITPLGWVIRAAFVFLGFCGIYCPAGWDEVRGTSVFLRRRSEKR